MLRLNAARIVAAALLWLSWSKVAGAEPVTWLFGGTIDAANYAPVDELFPPGSEFWITLTYESTATEYPFSIAPDLPEIGYYRFSTDGYDRFAADWSAIFSGHEYHLSTGADGGNRWVEMGVSRDTPSFRFGDSLSELATMGDPVVGTTQTFYPHAIEFGARWPGAEPFASDALPTTFPTTPVEGQVELYLLGCPRTAPVCNEFGGSVHGSVTSVQRVPEPSTLLLLTAGAVGLLRKRHTRRS